MKKFKTKLEPLARGFLECESEYRGLKLASGWHRSIKEWPMEIDKRGFAVSYRENMAYIQEFGEGLHCDDDIFNRLVKENPDDAEELLQIKELMEPYMTMYQAPDLFFSEIQKQMLNESVAMSGGWLGHAVPDYEGICIRGTQFYREKVEKYREMNRGNENFNNDFYDACALMVDAIDVAGARFYEIATKELETATDPERIEMLKNIKRTFDHAPQRPCRDFVEAVIVYIMVYTIDCVSAPWRQDSPGHIDQFFYDFWKVTDPALRQRYLEYLWEFFHDHRVWNVCLSGSDENGNDLSNELTYEILALIKKYKYQTPNVTLRWHKNSPQKLLDATYEALATGTGLPGLYNDHAVVPALMRLGIQKEDAHKYVMNGCNQIDIPGKSHMGLADGDYVLARAVEFALNNGVSNNSGYDFGMHTGDPADFETYEQFYDAVIKQLDHILKNLCEMANIQQRFNAQEQPNPLRSVLIEGCLEKGIDYRSGGPIYGHGQLLVSAIADAADSVAAIKKYVYEEKRFTIAEVADAMRCNYEGYEEMYQTFKNTHLKFGNDIPYVDKIAADLVDHCHHYFLKTPTFRGGFFSGGCSPFVNA
ncbi:MAG: hypothetical protein IJC98_08250, partial [Clostridia bacterium]|nr:hypothetical protein [Clostridia bacterium]